MERMSRRTVMRAACREHVDHRGVSVYVGGLPVFLGGAQYRPLMDLQGYDIIVPFLERIPSGIADAVPEGATVAHYPIPDFGGVPEDWKEFLDNTIDEIRKGWRVIAFCMGGHGRTGTFLASLIALLEPEVEDPIAAARNRYCEHAVETKKQAVAVFALKGQPLPAKYDDLR